jgi:hypothetical protein
VRAGSLPQQFAMRILAFYRAAAMLRGNDALRHIEHAAPVDGLIELRALVRTEPGEGHLVVRQ